MNQFLKPFKKDIRDRFSDADRAAALKRFEDRRPWKTDHSAKSIRVNHSYHVTNGVWYKPTEMRQIMNYSELEGKEVTYIESDSGKEYLGIVTGCEPGIGITIQEKESKRYLLCLNGPLSPLYKGSYPELDKPLFDLVVEMIIEGRYDTQRADDLIGTISIVGPSARTCPFAQ